MVSFRDANAVELEVMYVAFKLLLETNYSAHVGLYSPYSAIQIYNEIKLEHERRGLTYE